MGERESDDRLGSETARWVEPVLKRTRATLRFVIGRLDLPLSKAMSLQTGDVLTLSEPVSGRVDLVVDGTSIGLGELVEVGGQRGVRVVTVEDGRR